LEALIDGQLSLAQLRSVVTHLRGCLLCQAELVEVAAGSGAMRMASRPEVAAPGDLPVPTFLDQLGVVDGYGLGGVSFDPAGSPAEAFPAQEPAGAPGQPDAVITPMRRQLRWWMAAAAVVVVVLGIAAGVVSVTRHHPAAATSVALSPVGGSGAQGRISMVGDGGDRTMTVSTQLPPTPSDTYYEVWLLREPTGAMVPLGVLPPSGQARFVLPATLVSDYDAVDISLQPNNGSTVHSNDSVLRATYD
jgi:hypothetical protein